MKSTTNKTLCTCYTESLFLMNQTFFQKSAKLGSFLLFVQYLYVQEMMAASEKLI